MHTARLRGRPLAEPLKADYGKRLMMRREMNTQGKRASFSPCREESNAKKNTQNYCREPSHNRDGGRHRRGPQQSKTAIERSDVLRHATAIMPRQSRLSHYKTVANGSNCASFSPLEKSNGKENSQTYWRKPIDDWGSGEHWCSPQQSKGIFKCSGMLWFTGAAVSWQPWLSDYKKVTRSKRDL